MPLTFIERARADAERAVDLADIWKATVQEVTHRWERAGKPDVEPHNEVGMMKAVCVAMRDEERIRALNRIEEWRTAWITALCQKDFASTAKLNVIDSFRRAGRKN